MKTKLILLLTLLLAWCNTTPEFYNLNNPIYENLNLYCDYEKHETDERMKVCQPFANYQQVYCEWLTWNDIWICEMVAQEYYTEAITEFSKIINKYNNLK